MERDVKGLYKKAISGEIPHFTGVSDPYEDPYDPEIVVETNTETAEQSAARIVGKLEALGLIEPADRTPEGASDEDEDEAVRQRLAELGYV